MMLSVEKRVLIRVIVKELGGADAFENMWTLCDAVIDIWQRRHPDEPINEDDIIEAVMETSSNAW